MDNLEARLVLAQNTKFEKAGAEHDLGDGDFSNCESPLKGIRYHGLVVVSSFGVVILEVTGLVGSACCMGELEVRGAA